MGMSVAGYGAIAGAAQGVTDSVMLELEEAKATRLENLRHKNNMSANSQSNKERHDYSMSELAKSAELEDAAPTPNMKNMQYIEDKGGPTVAEQGKAGLVSSKTHKAPDDATMIDYLTNNGMSREVATSLVMSRKEQSPADFKRQVILDLKKNDLAGTMTEAELHEQAAQVMRVAYPSESAEGGSKQFNSFEEALEAAKARYPGTSEAELAARITEKLGLTPTTGK